VLEYNIEFRAKNSTIPLNKPSFLQKKDDQDFFIWNLAAVPEGLPIFQAQSG
jgi:hypothetical protein